MKLRRIFAGMAAAAMALAMTVVAHADATEDNEYAVAQIYIQKEGGDYAWVGSGENENARLRPGDTINLEWSPTAADLEDVAALGNPRIGLQLLNAAIKGQEGKEGSLKGSYSNVVISAGKGDVTLNGDDLIAESLIPKDEGGWFSGQTIDPNWIDTIKEKMDFDDDAYNEWFTSITKISVTVKLDSMTPYSGTTTPPAQNPPTQNPPATGAAAGIALALTAVAGAAIVVSKKKN